MTDDLIARLRDPYGGHSVHRAMMEAADTLERYKAALEWYESSLSAMRKNDVAGDNAYDSLVKDGGKLARQALNGEPS